MKNLANHALASMINIEELINTFKNEKDNFKNNLDAIIKNEPIPKLPQQFYRDINAAADTGSSKKVLDVIVETTGYDIFKPGHTMLQVSDGMEFYDEGMEALICRPGSIEINLITKRVIIFGAMIPTESNMKFVNSVYEALNGVLAKTHVINPQQSIDSGSFSINAIDDLGVVGESVLKPLKMEFRNVVRLFCSKRSEAKFHFFPAYDPASLYYSSAIIEENCVIEAGRKLPSGMFIMRKYAKHNITYDEAQEMHEKLSKVFMATSKQLLDL